MNVTQDIQGFHNSLQAVFDQHWVGHAHVFAITGYPDEGGRGLTSADGMAEANRRVMAGSTGEA